MGCSRTWWFAPTNNRQQKIVPNKIKWVITSGCKANNKYISPFWYEISELWWWKSESMYCDHNQILNQYVPSNKYHTFFNVALKTEKYFQKNIEVDYK